MTITHIPPAAGTAGLERRIDRDIRAAEAALEKIGEARVAGRTRLVCDYTILCCSTREVDMIAAEWNVPAGWTADLTQYRTLGSGWPVNLTAVYMPRQATALEHAGTAA